MVNVWAGLIPWNAILFLTPPTNCEGYVFTGVCMSTSGVANTPWQTPPWADTPRTDIPSGMHSCGEYY